MSYEDFTAVPRSVAYRLIHPRPVAVIMARDGSGKVNGMTASWVTPLSHSPLLLGVSIAPSRYTYGLIKETGEFTVNVFTKKYLKQVYFIGTTSGRDVDKLKQVELTLRESKKVRVPHLAEALAVLECRVEKEVEVGDHALFVARVVEAYAKKGTFDEIYDPKKAKILLHFGGSGYTTITDETLKP